MSEIRERHNEELQALVARMREQGLNAEVAAILNCRFGGPHHYFGQLFDKPYIGNCDRPRGNSDMIKAVRINRRAEVAMVLLVAASIAVRSVG